MSELLNAKSSERGFRWQLLTTASALTLLASINMRDAKAADDDANRPTVWVELGGSLERVNGQGEPFTPAFVAANPSSPVLKPVSPVQAENPPPFGFAEDGKISFQPEDSSWVFSAAINYGRSSNFKHVDHQTARTLKTPDPLNSTVTLTSAVERFANTQVHHRESHAIVDFNVGKDVGLGMFGTNSLSVLSLGVRFAQFASNAAFDARARPDLHISYATFPGKYGKFPGVHFHTYHAEGDASRSFRGVGPSLAWNGSTPFVGNPHVGEMTFDWGANAAILFGRQKAHVQHQETGHYRNIKYYTTLYQHPPAGHETNRSVTVPNVGGFAGASYRIENFKVSFGYRADFFFGAVDGGIDARKSETLGFFGPFATISVGLGG